MTTTVSAVRDEPVKSSNMANVTMDTVFFMIPPPGRKDLSSLYLFNHARLQWATCLPARQDVKEDRDKMTGTANQDKHVKDGVIEFYFLNAVGSQKLKVSQDFDLSGTFGPLKPRCLSSLCG